MSGTATGSNARSYDVAGALKAGLTPAQITTYMAANPGASNGYDVNGALKAGLTPEQVVDYLNPGGGHVAARSGVSASAGGRSFDVSGALGAGYSASEITSYMAANPNTSPMDVTGAMKAGWSPEEIVDYLNPNVARQSEQGVPILAPINRGIAHAQQGVANLVGDLGFNNAAADLRSRIPQQDLNAPTSGAALSSDLAAGHYGAALGDIPSAALEQTLPIAAGVASGALTGGAAPLAATAARLGGGALIGAATSGDSIARARAANNGEAAPSGSDMALGLAGGALTGAAGSVGLGGVGKGLGAAAVGALEHAASDASQPEMAALAGSAGTTAGAQNANPSDMAAAALTGLATRGALSGPDVFRAAVEMTPPGQRAALAAKYADLSPDQQTHLGNVAAAGTLLNGEMDNAVPGQGETRLQAAARTSVDRLVGQVGDVKTSLDAQGLLDDPTENTIDTAIRNARMPSRVLGQADLSAIDNLGLDQPTTDTLKNTAQQIALLSDPAVAQRGSGLLEGVGEWLGRGAGLALGVHMGHDLLGYIGAKAGAAIGQGIGAKVANKFGITDPRFVKQADQAVAMLNAAGVPVPDTRAQLLQAVATQRGVMGVQNRLLGLPETEGLPPATVSAPSGSEPSPGPVPKPQAPDPSVVAAVAAQPALGAAVNRAAVNGLVQPQGPTQSPPDAVAAARARAAAAPAMGGDITMTPQALALARLMPDWMWAHGASLQDALVASGKAQPINMGAEAQQSLAALVSKGVLTQAQAQAMWQHTGRVLRPVFNMIRNESLLQHGVDRTFDPNAVIAPAVSTSLAAAAE